MWDLPGRGLEPVSPALAGGFLTTAPPEKSQSAFFITKFLQSCLGGGEGVSSGIFMAGSDVTKEEGNP